MSRGEGMSRPRRRRGRCGLALAAALLLWRPAAAAAEGIVADLSSHLIAITTGFTGASVVLFGAVDGPGEVVVAVRGPEHATTVRRKRRILGVWVNAREMTFAGVPGFYAVAASRPLAEIVSPATAARYRLGVAELGLAPETAAPAGTAEAFAAALVRQRQQAGLFAASVGTVQFLGRRLFRTTIAFPASVPTGTYRADVLLIRDRVVVGEQATPLVVSKIGLDAAVYDFAQRRAGLYGAIAVLIAMMAGWLASLPFRNA